MEAPHSSFLLRLDRPAGHRLTDGTTEKRGMRKTNEDSWKKSFTSTACVKQNHKSSLKMRLKMNNPKRSMVITSPYYF